MEQEDEVTSVQDEEVPAALDSQQEPKDLVDGEFDLAYLELASKTEVSVTKNVKINVLLQAPDQRRVTAIVNFCVWDMLTMECQSFWITSWWYW